MSEWCEHIKIVEGKYTDYLCGNRKGISEAVFKFCPECGTPRPSEPKKLWEILMDNFPYSHPGMSVMNWQSTAKRAKEWFVELVERLKVTSVLFPYSPETPGPYEDVISKSDLLKKLREE